MLNGIFWLKAVYNAINNRFFNFNVKTKKTTKKITDRRTSSPIPRLYFYTIKKILNNENTYNKARLLSQDQFW